MPYEQSGKRIESLEDFKKDTNCISTALYILGRQEKDLYRDPVHFNVNNDPVHFNVNKLDGFERIEIPKKGDLVALLGNPPYIVHVAVVIEKTDNEIITVGREKHEGLIQKKTLEELIERYDIKNYPHYIRFYRLKEDL